MPTWRMKQNSIMCKSDFRLLVEDKEEQKHRSGRDFLCDRKTRRKKKLVLVPFNSTTSFVYEYWCTPEPTIKVFMNNGHVSFISNTQITQ